MCKRAEQDSLADEDCKKDEDQAHNNIQDHAGVKRHLEPSYVGVLDQAIVETDQRHASEGGGQSE